MYAVDFDGTVRWTWDYVKEQLGFTGDRWSGADWLAHKKGRVTWKDTFCCAQDIALHGKTVVVPAGGLTVWLADGGDRAVLRGVGLIPSYAGNEYPATFGQCIGADGAVYRQWHRRDNAGSAGMAWRPPLDAIAWRRAKRREGDESGRQDSRVG